MNAKTLIFLTHGFPFGKARETFVEHEIIHLAQAFDRVLIFAAKTDERDIGCRPLPNNCHAIKIVAKNTLCAKIFSTLHLLFLKRFYSELFIIVFCYKLKTTKNRLKYLFDTHHQARNLFYSVKEHVQSSDESYVVYAYWFDELAYCAAMLQKNKIVTSSICRAHRYDLYFYCNKQNYWPLRRFIYAHIGKIQSISLDGLHYLQQKLRVDGEKLSIARLGVKNIERAIVASNLSYQIVSCSYILKNKRLPLLAKALVLSPLSVTWHHLGDEPANADTPIVMSEIARLFAANQGKRYFFHGQKTNAQIFEFYQTNAIDLFINVSASEGVPVSIMEAMSFGIPVIATAVGGTPEIVNHEHNGFLLSANPEPQEIANAIERFYALTDSERLAMRQNAYNTWNEHFNAEKNYQLFCNELTQ